jgi:hypothetical protein
VVRFADLVEAEGRSLRQAVRDEGMVLRRVLGRLGLSLALLLGAAPLVILGLCLLLASLYLALRGTISPAGAAAVTGLVTLMVAGGMLWSFKKLTD